MLLLLFLFSGFDVGAFVKYTDGFGYEPLSYGIDMRYKDSWLESITTAEQLEKITYGDQRIFSTELRYTIKRKFIVSGKYSFVDFLEAHTQRHVWQAGIGWRGETWDFLVFFPDSSDYKTVSEVFELKFDRWSLFLQGSYSDGTGRKYGAYNVGIRVKIWKND